MLPKKPSVLGIVSFKVFPALMGGQKYIVDYYKELAKQTKVVLAVSKDNKEAVLSEKELNVLPFLFNHWYGFLNLFYCFKLVQIIKKEKIDIIIIDHSYYGWLGILLRFLTGRKLIIKSANLEAFRFRDMGRWGWQLYEVYEKWVLQHADRNFFISDEERLYAIEHWKVNATISYTIPYGTFIEEPYSQFEKNESRNSILNNHSLSVETKLFLFNGTLDYIPNEDALYIILNELVPRLNQARLNYRIIICGVQIKPNWEAQLLACPTIIFKGFVEHIELYNQGAHCFICPITLGTGVKTKITDAVAGGLIVIACKKSCDGFNQNMLNNQLIVVEDYNWDEFARAMIQLPIIEMHETPKAFYKAFNWAYIVRESILYLPK
ncbi:glycosyltransferase [Sediminibacterium sp.]|uniref:glycosyltransferase n=1 Tax=Sediminibacterium sp. TaxID=1917865 RepID=UPI002734B338|nr:glycosyltransferase [Sediminibacterium sp.]